MDVVIVAGSSDTVTALDSDTGKVVWFRQFKTEQKPKQQPMYFSGSAGAEAQTVKRKETKVGRNDPCPCGSGKKYKKCHGTAA